MKDAIATMGNVLPEDAGGRDAVHVAVFSAFADSRLFPGEDIAIVEQGARDTKVTSLRHAEIDEIDRLVGIVDPFLRGAIEPGARFWVYLYPRTITALSHRWSHPSFEDTGSVYAAPSAKLASEQWLRDFVARTDCPGYEHVLFLASARADGCDDYPDSDYLLVRGEDARGAIPSEFWDHIEIVLGRPIKGRRAAYFTCSC